MPLSMERLITAPFAERIAQEHPHMTLRVYEGINNAIRQWMEIGAVDVAVMDSAGEWPRSRFVMSRCFANSCFSVGQSRSRTQPRKARPALCSPQPGSDPARTTECHQLTCGELPSQIRLQLLQSLRSGGAFLVPRAYQRGLGLPLCRIARCISEV